LISVKDVWKCDIAKCIWNEEGICTNTFIEEIKECYEFGTLSKNQYSKLSDS
jgi:hypothetical protein